ncbi:pirin family protein [Amphritea sp.]|uniref:pirin family protein n=1 Tax=Amphritea sp. TaxID=1872502 RepID=UPI0025B9C01C|nr:pirin family protein [Amphritea sp.]
MITLRPGKERGYAKYNWLETKHSFSFANYYDPRYMGVSELLVINDDWVSPGTGFGTHPHRDMEIISYILEGSIEHKDTMGFHSILKAGDVQVMSAGTGIRHSEYNPSKSQHLNFLQIWIQPNQLGAKPSYQQNNFGDSQGITLIVSPDGQKGSLSIRQSTRIYKLSQSDKDSSFTTVKGRTYYLHIARGSIKVNGTTVQSGDGATIKKEEILSFTEPNKVEALLFELP